MRPRSSAGALSRKRSPARKQAQSLYSACSLKPEIACILACKLWHLLWQVAQSPYSMQASEALHSMRYAVLSQKCLRTRICIAGVLVCAHQLPDRAAVLQWREVYEDGLLPCCD